MRWVDHTGQVQQQGGGSGRRYNSNNSPPNNYDHGGGIVSNATFEDNHHIDQHHGYSVNPENSIVATVHEDGNNSPVSPLGGFFGGTNTTNVSSFGAGSGSNRNLSYQQQQQQQQQRGSGGMIGPSPSFHQNSNTRYSNNNNPNAAPYDSARMGQSMLDVEIERALNYATTDGNNNNRRGGGGSGNLDDTDDSTDDDDPDFRSSLDNSHDDHSTVEPSFFIIPPRTGGVQAASVASSTMSWFRHSKDKKRSTTSAFMSGDGHNDDGNGVVGSTSQDDSKGTTTSPTRPYRREKLNREIDTANVRGGPGHASVLKALKNAGVMIYIVDSKTSGSVADVLDSVRNIIYHVCKESDSGRVGSCPIRDGGKRMDLIQQQKKMLGMEDPELDDLNLCDKLCGPNGGKMEPRVAFHHETVGSQQRCLLYRDPDGRLFNLTLASHTTAIEGTWKSLLQSFSVLQAVTLLVVLCRSFSCPREEDEVLSSSFSPAYLTLLLGLIFSEELSLSWVNVAMFVRGLPSISAYNVISKVESDWLRKTLLLCLTIAGAMTAGGTAQQICTLTGLSIACCILLANLGARSWKFLGWKPTLASAYFGNCAGSTVAGVVEPIFAYIMAIMAGIIFPYLGHREIKVGGTVAIESILRIAIVVAGLFVLSGYQEVQKFLVVGSENCNQEYVNVAVGGWWTASLLACLLVVRRRKVAEFWPEYNEPILKEDQSSPVGYRVPHLPTFPFDPTYASRESVCFNLGGEFVLGALLALGVGGVIVWTGITGMTYTFQQD